ncbi:RidA family protein [Pelagibius sp. Alg239-R121]|uniref:RidA family protein n=1 Tax=Pelagibius sp. Alg239-R121 TaxID=2993448 RepID=UPI0024A70820|nr:Rid family hydrolase [Pelagibius sp. Alg239-R121]
MTREYSWPEGHWNWPVPLRHKHGVRSGDMIFTGGQVDMDAQGQVRNPGDVTLQCDNAMAYLATVLQDLGTDLDDLVKLVVYFVGDASVEAGILHQIGAMIGQEAKPAISTIPMPELCYPGLAIEIEGIAMRSQSGGRMTRRCFRPDNMPLLPPAFSHAIHCGDMIFTSDISAVSPEGNIEAVGDIVEQTRRMMDRLCSLLSAIGADAQDVLKLNAFYVGDGTAEDWATSARIRAGYFPDPGPAATGIPVREFAQPGLMTKIAVTAMRGTNGEHLEKHYAWPKGHWDWTTPLPYKHGNLCGKMIHLGGQVSLDSSANVVDPDDMPAQTRRAMDNIAKVLAELGASLDDVVKVTTFYQGSASAEALHENLLIRSNSYREPGPATTGIPVPALVYAQMVIEIEVIAMLEA